MNATTDALIELGWIQLWQVSVVALAVAALVRLACRRRPHLAYALWMIVLVKCLTPPLWSSPTGVFSWAQSQFVRQSAATEELGFAGMPAMPEPFAGPEEEATTAASTVTAVPKPTPAQPVGPGRSEWFALVWLGGAVLLSGWLAVKWLECRRWLARSSGPADDRWQRVVDELRGRLGVRRIVRLFVGDATLGPAAFGILRPKILLPAALLESKPPAQIEPILAHELMHVRRRDPAVGKLQLLVQVLWWFHPLVWWANRELRRQRERACDEEVLARLGCPPGEYARSLLDVLAWRRALHPAFAFPGLRPWEVTSKRLEHIMSKPKQFHRRMPRWCWIVLATAIALVLPGAGFTLHDRSDDEQSQLSPVIRDHYAVFPITTELQRMFLFGTDADVVLVVDVDSIIKDGDFHPEALDMESLRTDLSQYSDRDKQRTLFIRLRRASRPVKDAAEAQKAAYSPLESVARKSGFENVQPGRSFTTGPWADLAERLRTFSNESDVKDENPIGNDLVKVYPVRTKLSRYLTREADCVVDVLAQFAKDNQPLLDATVRDAVDRFVRKLKLRERGKLLFRIWTVDTPDEGFRTYVQFRNGEALELAKSLGFEDREVTLGSRPPAPIAKPKEDGPAQETKLRQQWEKLDQLQARAVTERHLHGLARAVHDYHRVHNKLPPAVVPNDKLPPEKRLSGLVLLLPHLDVESWNEPGKPCFPEEMAQAAKQLYKTIDLTKAWDDPANLKAARTVVPALLAPRGGPFRDENGFAVSHFAFVRGAKGEDDGAFPDERALDIEEIALEDGTSVTLGMGQINSQLGPWTAAGTSSARYVYHPLDATAPALVATFDSNFEGGCYFAKCDSSTFFVLDETQADVLYALTTRAGGELNFNAVKTRRPPRE